MSNYFGFTCRLQSVDLETSVAVDLATIRNIDGFD
ncbi:hypothetical protein IAD21_00227 [Abditibacteriota bacterium]|nr:hypothetical protein IAD21_00227 [Abditibacteriota bacterium]